MAAVTLPFLLAALTACSSGSELDSTPPGSTTTSSDSISGGGSGGLGGGATSTSSATSTGGTGGVGGTGGAGGASPRTGGGGAGGCEPTAEICNDLDDDCDGIVDNGDPGGGAECTTGLKGICAVGHESCIKGVISCAPDHGPGEVLETCNGLDDDCNGLIDEGLTLKAFYKDADGDGFGTDSTIQACAQPPGYAEKSGDCNDNNPNIYPTAVELCNDIDDNCNGAVDEGVQKPTFYKDNDGDGYGGVTSKFACTAPDGYVAEASDCNDANPEIYPGAPEVCNDTDDDCNGKIDDGLATKTIYKDNDGDGYAPSGALTQQKCNVPVDWALERDVDGDGVTDWDCNDSDFTVFPGAPTMCDGKDNDCDGVVDRLCFTTCAGAWPVSPPPYTAGGVQSVSHADLDGNGKHEILFQSDSAFQIVSAAGQVLRQEGTGSLNFSRGEALVGDIDNYDQFTPNVQTLEVLTANLSKLTYYKLAGGTISAIPSGHDVYDASPLMARDMDGDGRLELFTTSWCVASQGTRVFRYDRGTSAIEHVVDIADPDGACEYTDGRLLTDLDGDGVPELLFGNGYSNAPPTWSGRLHTRTFLDTSTLANDVYCAPGTCFSTDVDPLFPGSIHQLFRIGDELRAYGLYFAEQKIGSPALLRYWAYDLAGQPDAQSPSTTSTLWRATTDLDADGTPEDLPDVAYLGLFDVNGDGYPDRVVSNGKGIDVQLWDAATKKFASNPGSAKTLSSTTVRVGTMWDIDGSGRLAVLSTDESHNLYCHQLGPQTWLKDSSLPPHFPKHLRTFQWDNYEPNEGADLDGDNMPDADQIIQIPSALTNKGDFYGYISTVGDRDYYLIDAGWSAGVCLTSPDVASYSFEVYSFTDKGPVDGKPDGKVWENTSSAKSKCFYPGNVIPQRQGEHKYIVGIKSQGTASPYWPYWLSAPK